MAEWVTCLLHAALAVRIPRTHRGSTLVVRWDPQKSEGQPAGYTAANETLLQIRWQARMGPKGIICPASVRALRQMQT